MFDELKDRLEGCFYTIFTPFSEDESIDYENLEKYLTLLYKQGARKFYAMAYNSRYSQLTHDEIMELNEFCIKHVKSLDSKNIVIVGDPIHCSTKETIRFTAHAKEAGADLVSLLVREKYFTDEQIIDHYAEVGRETNMPILVHEMPFLSGYNGTQMHWPSTLMNALPKVNQIVALKEDAKNFDITREALMLEPNIRVIIAGVKSAFMQYKPYGAKAYLNGISIIDAEIGETFWGAYERDDQETIDFIINKLEKPFFDQCAGKYGWHRTNKALLEAAGYMSRRDRMPLKHLSDEEYLEVVEVCKQVQTAWNEKKGQGKA
ncbi:4-hydroxy-tetrahydrodipicolinate synthase [Aurantivibrio plasticivorans]